MDIKPKFNIGDRIICDSAHTPRYLEITRCNDEKKVYEVGSPYDTVSYKDQERWHTRPIKEILKIIEKQIMAEIYRDC